MFDAYYTCYPCVDEIHEEKERQEKLENRIKELERKLDLK